MTFIFNFAISSYLRCMSIYHLLCLLVHLWQVILDPLFWTKLPGNPWKILDSDFCSIDKAQTNLFCYICKLTRCRRISILCINILILFQKELLFPMLTIVWKMMSSLFLNKILILSVHIDFTTASFMVPPHTLVIRYKSLLKYKADKITICFSFMSLLMKINKFNFVKLCSRFLYTLN